MKFFHVIIPRKRVLPLLVSVVMSKSSERYYYAVGRGRECGIYETWKDCKTQIEGISNAKFKKFYSLEEAKEFVNFWKNYSSPNKPPAKPEAAVSKNSIRQKGDKDDIEIVNKLILSDVNINKNVNKSVKNGKNSFVLGKHDETKSTSKFDLLESYKNPYISPIPGIRSEKNYNNFTRNSKIWVRHLANGSCESKKKVETSHSTNHVKEPFSMIDCNRSVLESIKTPNTTFQFRVPNDKIPNLTSNTSEPSNFSNDTHDEVVSRVTHPQSDHLTQEIVIDEEIVSKVVKKEEVKIDCNQSENSQDYTKMSEIGQNLKECLNVLKTTLGLINKLNCNEYEKVKNSLKESLQEILIDTNKGVALQENTDVDMAVREVSIKSDNNEDDESEKQALTSEPEQPITSSPADASITSSTPVQQEQPTSTPVKQHQSPAFTSQHQQTVFSTPNSSLITSFEGNLVDQNLGTLALNMRLDSFEKRFDACLKEVGAIISEMSHIKSEIKEIKDALSSSSSSGSGVTQSPSKRGFQQTTLNFKPTSEESSSGFNVSSFSSFSRNESDSGEPEAKRGRNLKRRRSRSNSRSDFEEVLSKIKTEAIDYTSFSIDEDDYVEVYTDGACHSNGKKDAKAGIGIWFGDSHPLNVSEPVCGSATNNTAEIQAARVAIELAIKAGITKLKVITDSEFLINCITKWVHRWKRNGWTLVNGGQVKNRKELEKLDRIVSRIKVRWEKVEGHAGIKGNEMADRLANEGAQKYQR